MDLQDNDFVFMEDILETELKEEEKEVVKKIMKKKKRFFAKETIQNLK